MPVSCILPRLSATYSPIRSSAQVIALIAALVVFAPLLMLAQLVRARRVNRFSDAEFNLRYGML